MTPSFFFLPQTKQGLKPGPKVLILGSVHGNERCGAEALPTIFSLPLIRGSLTCVVGNPEAFKSNVRYLEADLNRQFDNGNLSSAADRRRREYSIAQDLKVLINEADILLDIHASTSMDSTPFVICESPALPLAQNLSIPYIVSGFDRVQPGGTDWFAGQVGKIGICVECGYLGDPKTTDFATMTATRLLMHLDMIPNSGLASAAYPEKPKQLKINTQYMTRTNFVPAASFPDFALVQEGAEIGRDGETPVRAADNGYLLFVRACDGPDQEAFLFAPSPSNNARLRSRPQ